MKPRLIGRMDAEQGAREAKRLFRESR